MSVCAHARVWKLVRGSAVLLPLSSLTKPLTKLLHKQMVRAANPKTRPQVLEILDSAKELGLTVLRIWAFSDGHLEWNALQRYPGLAFPHPFTSTLFAPLPF